MAQRLYDSIHSTPPDHCSGSSANPESSPIQSNQPTVTNNVMSDTTPSDQQVSLGIQLQQLQPQHLANLLLQAASQVSATLPNSSHMAAQPSSTQIQAAAHNKVGQCSYVTYLDVHNLPLSVHVKNHGC